MLFLSPLERPAQIPPAAALTRAAIAAAPVRGLALVQALLAPDEELKSRSLTEGGMTRLAELLYLHHPGTGTTHADSPPELADPMAPNGLIRPRSKAADARGLDRFHGVPWSAHTAPAFASVIEASYEDTRDCAGLHGLRDIRDVVAGHRATGIFHPGLWTMWSDAQGPLAVLLMAEAAPSGQHPPGALPGTELVYLGVAPRGRGQGLGGALVRYALAAARPFGGGVSLAVDRDNPAARRLYRHAGFTPTTRRIAWTAVPPPTA